MNNILENLYVPGQLPLDHKLWYHSKKDVNLGENNVLAYAFYMGMLIYCANDRQMFEWREVEHKTVLKPIKILKEDFTYPEGVKVNGVDYSNKTYNFFLIAFDNQIDLDTLVKVEDFVKQVEDIYNHLGDLDQKIGELGKLVNKKFDESKSYTDTVKDALEKEMELREKALRGELTSKEAELLLKLENQRREVEAELEKISQTLTNSEGQLNDKLNKEIAELNKALDDMQNTIDTLATNKELTDAELRNLTYLLNTIEQEHLDVQFKIAVLQKDQFVLPEHKATLSALEVENNKKFLDVKVVIETALKDKVLTEQEKKDINQAIDAFKASIIATTQVLLNIYTSMYEQRDDYFKNKLEESIKEARLYIQFSKDGVKDWHEKFVEGDKYMRQKNGEYGDWSDAIKVVGENGEGGQYEDFQFAKNTSLTQVPTSGWTDAPPPLNGEGEYLWMRSGTVIPPATTPSYWTASRISGPKGDKGDKGDQGDRGLQGLQGKDGSNGINAVSLFKSTAFIRSSAKPATPTGGDWNKPIPTTAGWTDGVTAGELPLYMSTRVFTNTGGSPQQSTWTVPQLVADTSDIDFEFSSVAVNPGNPTSHPANWVNTATDASIWMAVRNKSNGVWDAWNVTKIKGESGKDGISEYVHIAYANDAVGNGFSQTNHTLPYIGMYKDNIEKDSSDPKKYKWSYWKGIDGKNGVPGTPGADGKTPYFHIAYANSSDGKISFHLSDPTNRSFIGQYTDYIEADSTDPTKYTWSKIRGTAITSPTEPTDKFDGMEWIDTSKNPIEHKVWDAKSGTWKLIGLSQSEITAQIKKANDDLKKTMEEAIKDGVISANEALLISTNIAALKNTKRILDSQYILIYNDPYLSTSSKTDLQTKNTDFNAKHLSLIQYCEKIASQTSVTAAEKAEYQKRQNAYDASLTIYSTALEKCNNEILINQSGNDIEIGGRNYVLKSTVISDVNQTRIRYDLSPVLNKLILSKNYNIKIIVSFDIYHELTTNTTSLTYLYDSKTYQSLGDVVIPLKISDNKKWYRIFKHLNIDKSQITNPDSANWDKLTVMNENKTIKINNVQVETGNTLTDHKIAPEDVDEAVRLATLNAAQAKATADEARELINFLGKPNVATGTLFLGDAGGHNAFISGVTDKGDQSVRIGAGQGGYANKNTLPFRVLHNGDLYASRAFIKGQIEALSGIIGGFNINGNKIVAINELFELDATKGIIFRDKNKKVRMEIKLDTDGTPAIIFYDAQGNIKWKAGTTGIIYENFIAESYKTESFYGPLSGTPNASVVDNYMKSLRKQQTYYWSNNDQQGTEFLYGISGVGGGTNYYSYNAGKNPESENNKKYEDYLYSTQNKLGAKIANGWYVINYSFSHGYGQRLEMVGPGDTEIVQIPSTVEEPFYCARIVDGKIVERKNYKAVLQMSSPGGGNNGLVKEIPYSNVTF